MDYTIRSLTDDDLGPFAELLARAFLSDDDAEQIESAKAQVVELERSHGVFDGDRLVGGGQLLTRSLCVPGGRSVPFAGVTSISVAPDHRRRGVLRSIMRAQLDAVRAAGAEPIAALWASEAAIYGRFGYGLATDMVLHEIKSKAQFRPGVDAGSDPVRLVPRDDAMPVIRDLYDRYAAGRVGALSRTEASWGFHMLDTPWRRHGASSLRFVVHPDGYMAYRVRSGWADATMVGRVMIRELVALTPQAYAALLRHALDLDLIGHIDYMGAVDEPLSLLLQNPREAQRKQSDALYIRLVDVDRALMARDYAAPADVVIDVTDEFCPWNEGRWRFTVGADGTAKVARTDDAADVSTSTTDLAAAYLGGTRVVALAAAGRVREHTPGAVAALSAAFMAERTPACLEVF